MELRGMPRAVSYEMTIASLPQLTMYFIAADAMLHAGLKAKSSNSRQSSEPC